MAENDLQKNSEVKNVLTAAFSGTSREADLREKAVLEAALDIIMKTDEGRRSMENLAALGYTFACEHGSFAGRCLSDVKKILINPECNFDHLLPTIVHEGTHAVQHSLESKEIPSFVYCTCSSIFRRYRAEEADACAHQMAFTYQLKDVYPSAYAFAEQEGTTMFRAYVGEMEKSGDGKAAMQESFKAWYDCEYYRNYYDASHKGLIKQGHDLGIQYGDSRLFSMEYKAEDVINMCRYEGKPYMDEEFLNSPKAFSIPPRDKLEVMTFVADYARRVPGAAVDSSVMKMPSRGRNGEIMENRPNGLQGNTAVFSGVFGARNVR